MRYGVISTAVWDKPEFKALPPMGMLALVFIWSFQKRNSAGLYRESVESLAALSPWSVHVFKQGFYASVEAGFLYEDRANCVILVHNFTKHCQPSSPNIIKSWRAALSCIPRHSVLFGEWCRQSHESLRVEMRPEFINIFGSDWMSQTLPVEPQTEVLPGIEVEGVVPKKPAKSKKILTDEEFIAALKINPAYRGIDVDEQLHRMDAWLLDRPDRVKTRRFIVGWLNRTPKPMSAGTSQPRRLTRVGEQNKVTAEAAIAAHNERMKGANDSAGQ